MRRGIRPTWGVQREYVDALGARRRVRQEDVRAVEACLRPVDPDAAPSPAFVRPGEPLPRGVRRVELEDGRELACGDVLDRDAPYGYHHLVLRDGRRVPLITSPGRCTLPDTLRGWG